MRPILSTYRLQLHAGFRLEQVRDLIPYFTALGVTHLHCSPMLAARRGSLHGYDVTDPTRLNPGIGTEEELAALADELHAAGLGLLVDIVPNHMAASAENPFWEDVLTHGSASPYARWFDIEWRAGDPAVRPRVVLPVLGDYRTQVLERGELQLRLVEGRMRVRYFEHEWPVDPLSLHEVLAFVADEAEQAGIESSLAGPVRSLGRMLRALSRRRPRNQSQREAHARRAAETGARVSALLSEGPLAGAAARAVADFGAGAEGARRMRRLLDVQPYRLVFWRRAARELNYRRFFDVNELVALRVEDPEVFARTHARVLEWRRLGIVDGFRVDHPDGLLDPLGYLRRLADEAFEWQADGHYPVWIEKILAPGEELPSGWPVAGTTGYDFLNQAERLFVDPEGLGQVKHDYSRLIRRRLNFAVAAEAGKRSALEAGLSPGVRLLAVRLLRLSGNVQPPLSAHAARSALIEVITALRVYRTYVDRHAPEGTAEDRRLLEEAIETARARGRAGPAALDHLRAVLLGEPGVDAEREQLRLRFIQRFQQLTGAAMAKGVEDTAFYSWIPLASLNEVGGSPDLGSEPPIDVFHSAATRRAATWPATMLTVTTHDTKRSADVRARLDVLSECPDEWEERVYRWRRLTRPLQQPTAHGIAPDANTLYLFFQSLVGLWPAGEAADRACLETLNERLQEYMLKAVREAERRTSWLDPDPVYESAVAAYVAAALDGERSAAFLADVAGFAEQIAPGGWWNSIARSVLQLTSPGVPDLYQGDELWNVALVDPDNRRPVDFDRRRAMLDRLSRFDAPGSVRDTFLDGLLANPADSRLKLHVIRRLLHARRRNAGLFVNADYVALSVEGARAASVVAFARRCDDAAMVVVVSRLVSGGSAAPPIGPAFWTDTTVMLPEGWSGRDLRCLIAGTIVTPADDRVPVAAALARLPGAVLIRQ